MAIPGSVPPRTTHTNCHSCCIRVGPRLHAFVKVGQCDTGSAHVLAAHAASESDHVHQNAGPRHQVHCGRWWLLGPHSLQTHTPTPSALEQLLSVVASASTADPHGLLLNLHLYPPPLPLQMMYTIARYYSTPEHMTRLFTKITNQVRLNGCWLA